MPQEITAGGVSEDNPPDASNTLHDRSYDRAIKLQRLLLAAAGWPDCREVYEKNLREVEKRSLLLERIAARLRLIGRFGDHDVETRVRLAGHNLGIPKLARNG